MTRIKQSPSGAVKQLLHKFKHLFTFTAFCTLSAYFLSEMPAIPAIYRLADKKERRLASLEFHFKSFRACPDAPDSGELRHSPVQTDSRLWLLPYGRLH